VSGESDWLAGYIIKAIYGISQRLVEVLVQALCWNRNVLKVAKYSAWT